MGCLLPIQLPSHTLPPRVRVVVLWAVMLPTKVSCCILQGLLVFVVAPQPFPDLVANLTTFSIRQEGKWATTIAFLLESPHFLLESSPCSCRKLFSLDECQGLFVASS